MKLSMLVALVLLFTLISQQALLGAAEASPEQVVDTSGKMLRANVNYYILPIMPFVRCAPNRGHCISGASLGLAGIGEACPLDAVVVDRSRGIPVTFTPVNPKKGVIRVSTDLNIKFSTHTSCPRQSTVLKLDHFDGSMRQWFLTTGGVVGNPGWKTINNWFKIEKYDGAYKLVYCPSVVKSLKHLCKDVGVFKDEKGRNMRLALSDVPIKVKFQQA